MSIGAVTASAVLDTAGFERGVATTVAASSRLEQAVNRTNRPVREAGAAVEGLGHGFDLGSRTMDRFAAIGVERLIPALEGSRVGIEGLFQGVYRLSGGYATLILAGVGVAGFLGSYLTPTLFSSGNATALASEKVADFSKELKILETRAADGALAVRTARNEIARFKDVPSGPPGHLSRVLAAEGGTGEDLNLSSNDRAILAGMRARKALGDDFSEAIGLSGQALNKFGDDLSKVFTTLDREILLFRSTANEVLLADPLGKLLTADYAKTQALINKLIEAREQGVFTQEEFDRRVGPLAAEGGGRQIGLRDQFSKAQGPSAAAGLGLRGSSLLTGFADIDKLTKDIAGFSSEMERLARAGVPVRDLFPEIADGQAKIDAEIQKFKDKFADSPALLEKITDLDRTFGQGGLQKSLDGTVRSLQGVKEGTVGVIDTTEGIESRWVPALRNTGIAVSSVASAIDNGVIPAVADWSLALEAFNIQAFTTEVVILTGDVYALARAFQSARIEALALAGARAGAGTTTNISPPGNF